MDPIEQRVRESLQARADDVEPTPHLYRGVQERISRRQRLRAVWWSLAGAAAVAAAVLVVPTVLASLDQRTPEVADTPDRVEEPPPASAPGEPTHALLAFADGRIDLVDLDTGAREPVLEVGTGVSVPTVVAAPGSTAERFRAVAVLDDEGAGPASIEVIDRSPSGTRTELTVTTGLPGGSGVAPSVAISPDGAWLAYTGTSQSVDAATAVYVLPIEPRDEPLDTAAAEEVYTVDGGDVSDAVYGLLQWTGRTGADGDDSLLHLHGGAGTGALMLRRTDDGFSFEGRDGAYPPAQGALDLSSDFDTEEAGAADRFLLLQGDGPGDLVLRRDDEEVIFHDVEVEGASLDARGGTALVIAGGTATVARFEGDSGSLADIADGGVVSGALLGGLAPELIEQPDAPGDAEEVPAVGPLGDGLVVADDTTVSLVRPDGSQEELVTFPPEGESTVVAVAVRPGSTVDDLTVAITTRAEGTFDVRYLRVVDGAVDSGNLEADAIADGPEPDGEGGDGRFPAPAIGSEVTGGIGAFPLTPPDLQDGAAPHPVWSPDGDLLAVAVRSEADAPVEIHTIGWDEGGPNSDPNLAATFQLDAERPLTARSWAWTDGAETGGEGGTARSGRLILVDQLGREVFALAFERQGDGAPAMPSANLERVDGLAQGSVLDLADTDGDGSFELLLELDPAGGEEDTFPGPYLIVSPPEPAMGTSIPIEATGPRAVDLLVASEQVILVVIDPAQPLLVEWGTWDLTPAPIGGEVVSADLIR